VVTESFESLMRWQLSKTGLTGKTLDLDSTIMERYGSQEGSLLGFNPKKHRRPTHHPLIATLGRRPWVVHAWLRAGNTTSSSGAAAFLDETLALLPADMAVRFLRADSGFGVEPFLRRVEDKGLFYAVAARFSLGLKRLVAGITDWREIEAGITVSETAFQALGWSRSRRIILIRQHAKERDFVRGRELFDDPAYAYQAISTNLKGTPEAIWRYYRGHAEIETKIRELKWDYGIDGFCQQKFFATEAAFRLVCVTYNLISLLQERLGKKTHQTLGTLRGQLLACGAVVGKAGRRTILRLSLSGPWREQFIAGLRLFFSTAQSNCGAVETG
jgi:hypothetical protein